MKIRSCAVFCGSRFGKSDLYKKTAQELGTKLGEHHINLIYGGGDVGLMGTVADAALKAGGDVTGIIPEFLHSREVMHEGVTKLEITPDMHTRKALMYKMADAYVTLPGGLGTFDELIEILTWKQLNLHQKPIYIVNINNWAQAVIDMIKTTSEQGFAAPDTLDLLTIVSNVAELMQYLTKSDSN
ncbi:LOG family protein [Swingsia samuiensis]|uniref:Cytokinin riboside 5'-monophosphate phosphoribohydrolase n=1 Tax=Swingsia samuiensis TaxID=1293412 RepID=A0A4Y6UJP0_9PROT|nr:TIGR00730 family Rossman fold protein [Swingsia samuiensis]QDH17030.1 TIGR00730 family Rossman fold protein [Swingsia samuiensis]